MKIKYMIVEKYINGSPADIIIFHAILTGTNFIKHGRDKYIKGTFLMKSNVLIMIKQLILVKSIQ